jgi:hypothetical protein
LIKALMTPKLDDLLPAIKSASHTGLSFETLRKRFAGRSKGSVGELREMLDALVKKGVVRGPVTDGGAEYYFAAGRGVAAQKAGKEADGLLAEIRKAEDAGLSYVELRRRFVGRSKASEAELREELGTLRRKGTIRALNDGRTDHYFAADRGPSGRRVCAAVVRLVHASGIRLSTAQTLQEGLSPIERPFLAEALSHALQDQEIVELTYGTTKCYLHRDVAARLLSFDGKPGGKTATESKPPAGSPPQTAATVTMEGILPVYRRLREEQGGFSGVRIFDLMKAMGLPKEMVHPVLIQEAKAGRITIHRSASVELPKEVTDAGVRLPGFADPFVTFAVKKEK